MNHPRKLKLWRYQLQTASVSSRPSLPPAYRQAGVAGIRNFAFCLDPGYFSQP